MKGRSKVQRRSGLRLLVQKSVELGAAVSDGTPDFYRLEIISSGAIPDSEGASGDVEVFGGAFAGEEGLCVRVFHYHSFLK